VRTASFGIKGHQMRNWEWKFYKRKLGWHVSFGQYIICGSTTNTTTTTTTPNPKPYSIKLEEGEERGCWVCVCVMWLSLSLSLSPLNDWLTLCQQCGLIHHLQTHFSNHEEFCAAFVFHHPSDKNKNNQPISFKEELTSWMNEAIKQWRTTKQNMGEIK